MTDAQAKEATLCILAHWRWIGLTRNWNVEPRMQRLVQPNATAQTLLAAIALVEENSTGLNARGRRRLLRSLARVGS